MRGIKVPQAPPRSARPPPRAGASGTYQAIEDEQGFGWHKVRPTEVAAPTRRSGTARLISLTPKVRFRPMVDLDPDIHQEQLCPRALNRSAIGALFGGRCAEAGFASR